MASPLSAIQRREVRAGQRLIQRYSEAMNGLAAAKASGDKIKELVWTTKASAYSAILADTEPIGGAWTVMLGRLSSKVDDLIRELGGR